MLKIPMFETKESYADYLQRKIEAVEKNGLALRKKAYEDAVNGVSNEREWFLRENHISKENEEAAWQHHLEWMHDQVKYIEKDIRKMKRELAKLNA